MNNAQSTLGIGSLTWRILLSLLLSVVLVSIYYFYIPVAAINFIIVIFLWGFLITRDHVPIGAHGRIILREQLRQKEIAPPAGVPQWISRFASEGDEILLVLSGFGSLFGTLIFGISSLFIAGHVSSHPIAHFGTLQICFIPHLVFFVTIALRGVRDSLLGKIEQRFLAQRQLVAS